MQITETVIFGKCRDFAKMSCFEPNYSDFVSLQQFLFYSA